MDTANPKAIIIDIDGTLANIEHRIHHVKMKRKDWKSFMAGIPQDRTNPWCVELMSGMRLLGYKILLVTGRPSEERKPTEEWLTTHQIKYDVLYMRGFKDFRKDTIVKKEIYLERIKERYDVMFAVEDRFAVSQQWRELGLVCLHCEHDDAMLPAASVAPSAVASPSADQPFLRI